MTTRWWSTPAHTESQRNKILITLRCVVHAILWYVAGGSTLAPEERIERAQALQWMFFEQRSLEPNIGAAYFWLSLIKGGRDLQSHALEDWMENGYRALAVMEMHLAKHDFF